jgi:hypothetical protein
MCGMAPLKEDEIVKATFRIEKSRLKAVKQYGLDNDKTDTEIFIEALDEYLSKRNKK